MHRIYATPRASTLIRYCGQLIRSTWIGIDWRRPAIRDGVLIFGVVAAIHACAHWYRLPPILFQFGIDYTDWEIDDIMFVLPFLAIGLAIYSYRRVKDLSREMKARRNSEMEARKLARHDPLTGLPNRRFFRREAS